MRMKIWAGLLMGFVSLGAAAQTVAESEQTLREALVKRPFYLRGFSAETELHWRWNDGQLVGDIPGSRMWGVFTANSVKVKGSKISIDGERAAIVRNGAGYGLSGAKDHVHMVVDLTGADVTQIMPQLPALLFYPTLESALAATRHPPPNAHASDQPSPQMKQCDCASPSIAVCGTDRAALGMTGLKAPSVAHSFDPKIPPEAMIAKVGGVTQLSLIVGHNGLPSDVWITKSAGKGMDAEAGAAVSQYTFKPATCHGNAIPVMIYFNVNFVVPESDEKSPEPSAGDAP